MSRRTRLLLAIIGLLVLSISLAALVYAAFPPAMVHETTPLAPTLFTLPPGGAP